VLKLPLPFQKVIITTTGAVRIVAADGRPRLVNRAAAGLEVEEHADAAVDLILLMPEDRAVLGRLREALGGRCDIDLEVLGETVDVAFRNADVVVTAAVRRAFAAVVKRGHHEIVTVRRIIAAWITPSRSSKPISSSTAILLRPNTRSSPPPDGTAFGASPTSTCWRFAFPPVSRR